MLQERTHRYGARRACSSSSNASRRYSTASGRTTSLIAPPEVGIIPGNRFFLVPLKKVSALVLRHHGHSCRSASATSTRPCIRPKPGAPTRATAMPTRSVPTASRPHRRRRRQYPAVAKTLLGTISEQDEGITKPLLADDPGSSSTATTPRRGSSPSPAQRIRSKQSSNNQDQLVRSEQYTRRVSAHHYFRNVKSAHDHHHVVLAPSTTMSTTSTWPVHPQRISRAKATSIFTLDIRRHQPDLDGLSTQYKHRVASHRRAGEVEHPKTSRLISANSERELFVSELVERSASLYSYSKQDLQASGTKRKVRSKLVATFGSRSRVSPYEHVDPLEAAFAETRFAIGRSEDVVSGRRRFDSVSSSSLRASRLLWP